MRIISPKAEILDLDGRNTGENTFNSVRTAEFYDRKLLDGREVIKGRTLILATFHGHCLYHAMLEELTKFRPGKYQQILVSQYNTPHYCWSALHYYGVPTEICRQLESGKFLEIEEPVIHNPGSFEDRVAYLRTRSLRGPTTPHHRIVILRKKGRELLISSKIERLLRREGFEFLYLESLSFYQQLELFSNCSHVIAAHGSALTNLVYANVSTQVLEVFNPCYQPKCYERVASIIGLYYKKVFGKKTDDENYMAHIDINDDEFISVYDQWMDRL